MKILTWFTKGQIYGIDLQYVSEVVESIQYIQIPRADAFVTGFANLRGEVIMIIDLKHSAQKQKKEFLNFIRLNKGSGNIGIFAEKIHEVFSIKKEDHKFISSKFQEKENEYIISTVNIAENIVPIVDTDRLIGRENNEIYF